ncbi:tetratricopeptide repeat protein [Kitasatospora sp. MMS16-BH015]|uniref:tetratricopeptide repeat protein n=1 Tax=Kitasatospora sp. MMS16-BH015 TaxID=2018025 RepID=UPI00131A52E9|nr:tetratricopeptide repeat protein [Kitasatospora sp. MMS16-BH015]
MATEDGPGVWAGRQGELAALAAAGERGGVLVVAGRPGSGRTSLAVRYAGAVAGEYPDGVLYARVSAPDGSLLPAGRVARQLLGQLGESASAEPVPGAADPACAEWRAALRGRRVLVVLDDVGEAEQLKPLLAEEPGSLVLATTAGPLNGIEGIDPVILGGLGLTAATELLSGLVGGTRISCDPVGAAKLVEACGAGPAALRLMAGWLKANGKAAVTDAAAELAAVTQPATPAAEGRRGKSRRKGRSSGQVADPLEVERLNRAAEAAVDADTELDVGTGVGLDGVPRIVPTGPWQADPEAADDQVGGRAEGQGQGRSRQGARTGGAPGGAPGGPAVVTDTAPAAGFAGSAAVADFVVPLGSAVPTGFAGPAGAAVGAGSADPAAPAVADGSAKGASATGGAVPVADGDPLSGAFLLGYRALSAGEGRMLRMLTLAPGQVADLRTASALVGCPAPDAGAVLQRLAERELVEVMGAGADGVVRYRLPGRLYGRVVALREGADRAAEVELARARLLERLVRLVDSARELLERGSVADPLPGPLRLRGAGQARAWLAEERDGLIGAAEEAVAAADLDGTAGRLVTALLRALPLTGRAAPAELYRLHGLVAELAGRSGDSRRVTAALLNLGDLQRAAGRWSAAAERYRAALENGRAGGDETACARALESVAGCHRAQGDAVRAADWYGRALALRQGLGERAAEARLLARLAEAHTAQRRFEEAEREYRAALALLRRLEDAAGQVAVGTALRRLREQVEGERLRVTSE